MATVDAAVARPVDAAPAVDARPPIKGLHREYKGFDFRAVPLDDATIGTEEECVVGKVDKLENGFRVRCESYGGSAFVDVTGVEHVEREDIVMLRIEASAEQPISATARFVAKIGRLPEKERPSRCCRDRDRDRPPEEKREPPEAYDFGKVWEDKARGKDKVCEIRTVGSVEKIDPTAARPAFEPEEATFVVDVWCGHASGSEQVLVGSKGYAGLLRMKRDTYVLLRVWSSGGYPVRAMFLREIWTDR
jgi:hypothetical protein